MKGKCKGWKVAVALVLGLGGLFPEASVAAPAAPEVTEITQPDGNRFRARLKGDEWDNFVETEDGFTVGKDSAGVWRHVSFYNGSQPVLDTRPAQQTPVNGEKHLRPSPEFLNNGPPDREDLAREPLLRQFPRQSAGAGESGSRVSAASVDLPSGAPHGAMNGRILFILASFSNQAGTYSEAQFATFVNDNIADYFAKASHGKVNLTPAAESYGTADNGVVGWVNLGYSHPNTGQNTGAANQTLTKNAILAADPYVDFASFDVNMDGYVDADELAVVVVAAGNEQSSGGPTPAVWGHKWSLSSPPMVDGVWVGAYHGGLGGYAQFGEKQGGHQATAGIMVHELGHLIFGLPDLYDTDYSARGIGNWCVMSGGSWGRKAEESWSGQTPVMPSAWVRYIMGWADGAEGAGATSIRAAGSTVATSANTVFKLTTSTAGEYFLVENRQPLGYDEGLEATLGNGFSGGLAIWHIDENKAGNTQEWYPGVSATSHLQVALEQADGLWQLEKNQSSGNTADLFRSGFSFGAATTPNSNLYSGGGSLAEVTSVSASGETMSAVLASSATPCGAPGAVTVPAGNATGSFSVSWSASATPGVTYQLEEAAASDFSGAITLYSGASLSYGVSGKTDGSYYYRVRAVRPGYVSSAWVAGGNGCLVSLPPAGTPASLTVPANDSAGSYTVTWGASATAGASYELQEAADSGFTSGVRTVYAGTSLSAVVTGNGNGTYYYRVRALKSGFNPSAWRSAGNGCVVNLTCQPPGTVIVPASDGTGAYTVTWTASPTAGVLYELQESPSADFSSGVKSLYLGSVRGWTISAQPNGSWYYRVRAIKDEFAASGWKTGGNACTVAMTPCAVPSSLTVAAASSSGKYTVSWGASSTAGVTYELWEATDSGFSAGLRLAYKGTGKSAVVTKTANGTFYYRIRATKAGLSSSEWRTSGNAVSITLACGAPSAITVPASSSTGAYTVSWKASDIAGSTYTLEQAKDAAFTVGVQAVYTGTAVSAKLTVSENATYYYRVKAAKAGFATSAWKAGSGCVTVLACKLPASITVPSTSGNGAFLLKWGKTDIAGAAYVLEEARNAAFSSGLRTVYTGTALQAPVSGLVNGSYYYRVRASRTGFADSPWKTATVVCQVNLQASSPGSAPVVPANSTTGLYAISWSASGQTGASYEVEEATDAGFTANLRQVYKGTKLTATVSVPANGTYYYRVRALKAGSQPSSWSAGGNGVVVSMPSVPAFSGLTVSSANSTGAIAIAWGKTSLTGAVYELQEATDAGFTQNLRTVYKGAALKATATVTADAAYRYRVRATKAGYSATGWVSAGNACTVSLACGVPPSLTVPASSTTGSVVLKWTASNVAAVLYVVEKAADAGFTSGVGEVYQGKALTVTVPVVANGTFYFRVKATRPGYADSPWRNGSGACVVGPACGPPASITYPKIDALGAVKVSWGASNIKGVTYEVEQSTDSAFTAVQQVYQGSLTTVTVPLVADGTYYFRVRATKPGYASSAWVKSVGSYGCAVTLAAPVPASLTVPKTNATGSITLAWKASKLTGSYYAIEEASAPDFSNAKLVYVGSEIKTVLPGRTSGTYYYRVKAFKAGYAESAWKAGASGCLVTVP